MTAPGSHPAAARAVFFEEEAALTVASLLAADGWSAAVVRERLAGEDDDEDHPWAVLSDAPEVVLELLVERYDGWLDVPEEPASHAPLDLPSAPRRRTGEG